MDINLEDYDLSNVPVEVELDGVKYAIDRQRQRHYIETRNWLVANRLQLFMGDTLRFNLMPAEASGIAVAQILSRAPTPVDILTDPVGSTHLMAQAIKKNDVQVPYEKLADLEHFDQLLAIWNAINSPKPKAKDDGPDPTTHGGDQST